VHDAGDLVALADRPQRIQVRDIGLLRDDGQVRRRRATTHQAGLHSTKSASGAELACRLSR